MELNVTVERINDVQEFASKKGDGTIVRKYSFVGKTNERFPKLVCFTCYNEEVWHDAALTSGMRVQVSFDISSREWNGKWFTEVSAWKITKVGNYQKEQSAPATAPQKDNLSPQSDVPF